MSFKFVKIQKEDEVATKTRANYICAGYCGPMYRKLSTEVGDTGLITDLGYFTPKFPRLMWFKKIVSHVSK